jgi:sugar lactone lactonase YvrE
MSLRTFAIALAALTAACTKAPEPPTQPPAADVTPAGKTIVAKRGGFIPEGIEYDQIDHRYLTGSLVEGTIFEIHADGAVVPFVTDSTLVSSVGIEVDEPRDRLLVANSDRAVFQPGATGQAKLNVYSLTTGERLALVDLAAAIGTPSDPPAYFANDLTVDLDGNVYVTDSRQNVIYKVTPDYQASVLYRFAGPLPGGAALNGIVYHSDGYLLAVANEHIYKVPVANPAAMTEVMVDQPVPGQDGAVWSPDGPLAVVSNSADAPMVVKLQSTDGWATAKRVAVAKVVGQATTAAAVGGDIYVIHPHFNDADAPVI